MSQKQNEKDTLLCTHKACKKPQTEDGEYCEKHYPRAKVCYCSNSGLSVPHYTDDHAKQPENFKEYQPYADMADVCELAHKFTVRECELKKIEKIDKTNSQGTLYTAKVQKIFDYYFEQITSTLNV
jgi:hypothetical protein